MTRIERMGADTEWRIYLVSEALSTQSTGLSAPPQSNGARYSYLNYLVPSLRGGTPVGRSASGEQPPFT